MLFHIRTKRLQLPEEVDDSNKRQSEAKQFIEDLNTICEKAYNKEYLEKEAVYVVNIIYARFLSNCEESDKPNYLKSYAFFF